jgi:hypothetical protein
MITVTKFADIADTIDLEMLPPDPFGRTLEDIEVVPVVDPVPPTIGSRMSLVFEIRMWYGDKMVWTNCVAGHCYLHENNAITYSTHMYGFAPFVALMSELAFEIASHVTGK